MGTTSLPSARVTRLREPGDGIWMTGGAASPPPATGRWSRIAAGECACLHLPAPPAEQDTTVTSEC